MEVPEFWQRPRKAGQSGEEVRDNGVRFLNLSDSSDSLAGDFMDGGAENFAALAETAIFLRYFKDMPDDRQVGKVIYPLDEILLLCLLAVLAGSETFTEIARFGEKKLTLLRRFRPFEDGTPAHDHLGDIFATLDAAAFQRCFVAWAAALTKTPVEVIAIDGKTLRRSYQKKGSKEPIHMVSAFAARQRLVMGQIAVAEKSNEIVAIPALLDMMAIEGAVVTIDAMGCQRNITKKIIAKKADYGVIAEFCSKTHSKQRRGSRRVDFVGQRYRASGLNLVVAAIILWNTVYLGRAVDELRSRRSGRGFRRGDERTRRARAHCAPRPC